jgi:tellurite resistance-related uncharacterized protein
MKIFVLFDGGLGNQLFEYACGRALALRGGGELVIDPWECRAGRSRPLELHHFNIKARSTTAWENALCRLVDSQRLEIPRKMLQALAPGLLPTVVRQREHGFDPAIFNVKGSLFLDGWWQSELYFRDYRDQIISDLNFRELPDDQNRQSLEQIRGGEAVCIHVRRGDYVSDPYILKNIGVCGLEYYRAAIETMAQRVKSPTYFIFSDDPQWTRENLPVPEPRVFISHNCGTKDWEDLRLLSACRHFIIANSTFSWWGAWLSAHPGKAVIAPSRWFAKPELSARDLIPESWIRI